MVFGVSAEHAIGSLSPGALATATFARAIHSQVHTMAIAARRPCRWPGCGVIALTGSLCATHALANAEQMRMRDAKRGTASERGYTSAWRRARARWLREHPLCTMCDAQTPAHAATEVDHRIPHCGNQQLFWDETNWQGGCKAAHSTKTARENGGFGNTVRKQAVGGAR